MTLHQGVIWALDLTADDSAIATASEDGTVRLWERSANRMMTLQGHQTAVYGVSFSRDGQYLASSSADNTVKVWRRDRQLLRTLRKHQAIAISGDGQFLATAGEDNNLMVWNLPLILQGDLFREGCTLVQDYLQTN